MPRHEQSLGIPGKCRSLELELSHEHAEQLSPSSLVEQASRLGVASVVLVI